MRTIQEFITDHSLTMTAEPVKENPNMTGDMVKGSRHFAVTIQGAGGALQTFYSVGSGIVDQWIGDPDRKMVKTAWVSGMGTFDNKTNRKSFRASGPTLWADDFRQAVAPMYRPELADVLDCLASDASSVEGVRNFEDWAGDIGYDPDSRSGEATYKIIERQAKDLRYILATREIFETLLHETERL